MVTIYTTVDIIYGVKFSARHLIA